MEEEKDQEGETKEKGHRDPDENINLLCRQACGSCRQGRDGLLSPLQAQGLAER